MSKRFLRKYDGRKLEWLRSGRQFALMIILLFLVFRFVIGVSQVSGYSMYPTLKNCQPVVFWRMDHNYRRGDVIAIHMTSGEYYVKRIIGIPGDEVELTDASLYINGEKELGSYFHGETNEENGDVTYPLVVGAGQYFVVGDNREESVDSRSFGTVAASQIRGRLIGVR